MTEQILHIKDGKKEYFLDLKDLLFIKADGNFCDIYQKVTAYKTVRIQIGQSSWLYRWFPPAKHTYLLYSLPYFITFRNDGAKIQKRCE